MTRWKSIIDKPKSWKTDRRAGRGRDRNGSAEREIFGPTAQWLGGFRRKPDALRFIYTAENDKHAAEKLEQEINEKFSRTYYLNTVIGKMSDVARGEDCKLRSLAELCPGAGRAHLVEEFNWILISDAPGIETRSIQKLLCEKDLFPLSSQTLRHNATISSGFSANSIGLRKCPSFHPSELLEIGAIVLKNQRRSLPKYAGWTTCSRGRKANYANGLIDRMQNVYLSDSIDRVIRDIHRKLSWDDRVIGTMRLALNQRVKPMNFAKGALLACRKEFGSDIEAIRKGLEELWEKKTSDGEAKQVFDLIVKADI